ncbi:hypothetical protein N8458_01335 [Synechococcus sp. AH-601-P18]|nr:hypothetical protein [Synechococcus sp. AH-601-P18]
MATFFVDSTGVVTTASTDSDSIFIQSAAVRGSELLGLAGNDTINITQGAAADGSAVGMIVKGADGDDLFLIDALGSFSAGDHTLIAGAGNDTVNLSGSSADWLKGNGGADRFILSGTNSFSAIALGAGADELVLQSATTINRIALGDGHDKISASTILFATAASLVGGAGRDTIDLTIGAASISTALINGGAAQDSITLAGLEAGSTVKGMGGDDTITLSGQAATSAFIAAGADNDMVTISGLADDATLAGGGGADTIRMADNINGVSAEIFGGSGNDSIHFDGIADLDTYSASVVGGAGADTIRFSAAAGFSGSLGILSYSSFSESDLTNTDVLSVSLDAESGGTVTIDYTDNLTAVTVGEVSAAVLIGNATFSGNITENIVTLSGDSLNVSSVTAVAGTVDTLTLGEGKGASVLFSNNEGEDYFFVQGGAAGTADDSIISLGDLSGATMAIAASTAMNITFSGQA